MTRPYICRCDDGEVYFVKGRAATRRGLVSEWLSACLATGLGLPIAPYDIAEVPQEFHDMANLRDLGTGPVFASRRVVAAEFSRSEVIEVPLGLRFDVLCFDRWIQNGDRQLSDRGGNPNLLWEPRGNGQLTVIDHNLAFDDDFDVSTFCDGHVFHEDIYNIFADVVHRQSYVSRFRRALQDWDAACERIPPNWLFIDDEQTVPIDFSIDDMRSSLELAFMPDFWNC